MKLDLGDLRSAPAQVWGGVRLVPLIRDKPVDQLRLHTQIYDSDLAVVDVDPRTEYLSYIPHGFVANWTEDGSPAAAYGTEIVPDKRSPSACVQVRFHRRMARRTDKDRLRFLPMHLAMEGYLALHFGGPSVVWEEWSQRAIRHGLSPRVEQAYVGAEVDGLADALRVFEIHPGQCGVAVYVADAFATAFVVPHPDDYRALHTTLIQDLYGELIYHYAHYAMPVRRFEARLSDADAHNLRAAVRRERAAWAEFHDGTMAAGLLDSGYDVRRVYTMGDFTLSRFLPSFQLKRENHIGELITDRRGRTVYLKTFRLAENQVRRGYLLTRLAAADWHLRTAADELGISESALGLRIESAGFGHLLREDVLAHYRKVHAAKR